MKHINQLAQQLQVSPEVIRNICQILDLEISGDAIAEQVESQLINLKAAATKENMSLEEAARHLLEMRDRTNSTSETEDRSFNKREYIKQRFGVDPETAAPDSFVGMLYQDTHRGTQFGEPINTNLANRVYKTMQTKGYQLFKGEGEVNIIYLRGVDKDGKRNSNAINEWSDRRLVLIFRNGQPTIVGNWAATVKPGIPAIRNPLGKAGAAFIEPGQYQAWRVDTHHGIFGRVEEGLVQVAPVKFRRDVNRDGNVDGEPIQSGMIGLNQHSGSDQLKVDQASYACLAGQSESGHLREFMPLVKSDPRYRQNRSFLFTTTILDASDL